MADGLYPKERENNKKVYAPYNFVPFGKRVLERYASLEELPAHNRLAPDLLSGELRVTLTAQTPVFISNGQGRDAETNTPTPEKVDFYKGGNGCYQIPASTLRGMLRENMQILGLGQVQAGRDVEDHYLYYRVLAAARGGLKGNLAQSYKASLGIKVQKTPSGGQVMQATRVKAAVVTATPGGYTLTQVEHHPIALRIKGSRNPLLADAGLQDWEEKYACYAPVWYSLHGQTVALLSARPVDGARQGWLLRPGIMRGQNHLYLFCAPEKDAPVRTLDNSHPDILDYLADYEIRQNGLSGTDVRHKMDKEFWQLPKPGETKPMFWLEADGHLVLGMSQYLRTSFRRSLKECLPEIHQQDRLMLDYPNSILGFADSKTSYRSRVRVGDFSAPQGTPKGQEQKAILGNPKPTFFGGYAMHSNSDNDTAASYNEDDTQLRGYKQYWLKKDAKFPPVEAKREKVTSTLHPLPKGTRFTGTIRYENLHEDELGLLLWALLLEDGCCQSIGMGKPLGLGRMSVQLDGMTEETGALYTRLDVAADPIADPQARARQLIRKYQEYADGLLALNSQQEGKKSKNTPSLVKDPSVKGLLYLRRKVVDNQFPYNNMELGEFRKAEAPLPLLREFENSDKTAQEAPPPRQQRGSAQKQTGRGGRSKGFANLAELLK